MLLNARLRCPEQEAGAYSGFDEQEFTCRSGGKPAALRHIKVGWLRAGNE